MVKTALLQQQKLQTRLSPTQIQVIRMLEIPSVELTQRINEELQSNPALEEGSEREDSRDETVDDYLQDTDYSMGEEEDDYRHDPLQNEDFNYEQYVNDDETPEYATRATYVEASADTRDIPFSGGTSLMEELKAQIYLTKMTKPQRHIAKWVLGNIDDDGYLRRSIEQLVDDLSFQEGLCVTDDEMRDIVQQIKQFDPAGVAAADLQECLLMQLKRRPQTESVQLAERILTHHFNDFSRHHYERLLERLGVDEAAFQQAVHEIVHLNQKPANAFNGNVYENHRTAVIPDFYVECRDDELFLTLNTGDIPELRVSADYQDMLDSYQNMPQSQQIKEASRFIRTHIDNARWFIDAIRQRNETLLRTMTAIMHFQREFFEVGDDACLRPMILQDIADRTGYDVSTISRVSNSKYVQTQWGVYPLKHFFSESMLNSEGEEISTHEIRQILLACIAEEDKQQPLTDDQLEEILEQRGYPIARRTVAKYREHLGIPVARLRRQL